MAPKIWFYAINFVFFHTLLHQIGELGRLSTSMKKLEKELKNTDKYKVWQYQAFCVVTIQNSACRLFSPSSDVW